MERPDAAEPASPELVQTTRQLVSAVAESCETLQRADLAQRLRFADARLTNPATVLYVTGEYKQGKSLLVNALIGRDVCPVDDDLSTAAVTWLYHHENPAARVRRRENGDAVVEDIPLDSVWRFASEQGNPHNRLAVDLVEIGLPSPLLARGLNLVDSPGSGALRGGRSEATLAFLPYADALIFVTDASAELSAPEITFLRDAWAVCPEVVVVLTKIDLYPEWRRVAELDREHLRRFDLPDAIYPVSSALRREALARSDSDLNGESGIPDFLAAIGSRVLPDAEARSAERALRETAEVLAHVLTPLEAEQHALADPASVEDLLAEYNNAQQRVADLRKAGSRWTTVLGDGIMDLTQRTDYQLRASIRSMLEAADEHFGSVDPARGWDAYTESMRTDVAVAARETFDQIRVGAEELVERVSELLEESGLQAPELATANVLDVDELWGSSERSLRTKGAGIIGTGLGAVRGTTSGVMVLGVIGRLAGIALATPVAVGIGVAFGAKQLLDERKRQVERRRQEARTILRGFLNQAQMELGTEARRAVQEIHRHLRDSFAEQIEELNGTYTEALRSVQQTVTHSQEERRVRRELLESQIGHLGKLLTQTDGTRRRLAEARS